MTLRRATLLAASFLLAASAVAQDGEMQPVEALPQPGADALHQAQVAAAHGDNAEALSRYLRVLAATPDNIAALVGAGQAALAVGDTNAAAGFLARADALDPRNGQVKAGLADTMLANGDARAALRLFNEAVGFGISQADIAADRGLAYDLRGAPKRAQADYGLALQAHPSDELTRRLAISYAIAGDRAAALATLDPLLRKQDVPAWRDRMFVYALTGDVADAEHDAAQILTPDQAAAVTLYLPRLAALKPADKAAAIHLGRFPGEGAPAAKPTVIAAPRLPVDKATLTPPAAPAQTFAQVQVAAIAATPSPAVAPAAPSSVDDGEQARRAAALQAKLDARARAAQKRRDEAEAAAKAKRAEEAEERAAARRNPARHWVQVAGGANRADLGKAWSRLKDKWPSQLAGKSPWTEHYRFTNRLLIGPFPTSKAAQDWVSARAGEGFPAFRVETSTGDPVDRVD